MPEENATTQTVLNPGGWSTRTLIFVAVALFLLGAGMGAWGYHTATNSAWLAKLHTLELKLTQEQAKPPVVKEVVRTQTQTEVAYVPKETVVYRDSKTGRELTEAEIESLNVSIKQPDFHFSVNGNPAKFSKTADERWIFDKNKGQLTQTSTASIDVKIPTVDKTKRFGMGIYSNTESAGVFVTSGSVMLMGGAKYGGGISAGAGIQAKF